MNKNSLYWFNKDNYVKCYWHLYKPIDFYDQIQELNSFYLNYKHDLELLIVDEIQIWFICCSIYTSNNIEDCGTSLIETKNLVYNYFNKADNSIDLDSIKKKEVIQHIEAYEFLCINNKGKKLSKELILETHKILMNGLKREDGIDSNAGSYRLNSITVGRSGIPCTNPEYIENQMNDIIDNYNNENDKEKGNDPIYNATKLKYNFLKIHPFIDGNGRLSRLLLNWSLLSNGLPFPVILKAGVNKNSRKNYFNCFKAINPDKVLSSLILESINTQFYLFLESLRFSKDLSNNAPFIDLTLYNFLKENKILK